MIKFWKKKKKAQQEPDTVSRPKTAALVFDRFYAGEPNAVWKALQRVIIATVLSFLCIGYVFWETVLPINGASLALISAGFAALFSAVFWFAGRRVPIIVTLILSGILILWQFDAFWERFTYFADGVMQGFNGRLFDTTPYLFHPPEMLLKNGLPTDGYSGGVVFGCVIVCALFAMITAAGLVGKPCVLPSAVMFVLMWSPKLGSERLFFNWRLIPIIALYAGAIAIGVYYRDGLVIRHVYMAGGYRRKVNAERKRFDMSLKSQNAGQRASSRGLYYSKYFSSVVSAAAMFAALGIVLNIIFNNSAGIDYQSMYEKLRSIDSPFGIGESVPFKKGAEANYFTSPKNSVYGTNNRLRLTAPSRSTKEILRVKKPITSVPLYLRGDIGIDFDGESWSSPVNEEPSDWGMFRGCWVPIEMTLLEILEKDGDNVLYINADVEYLCDTDVVFVPAYDGTFGVFTDDTVNVFGDYAARRVTDTATGDKRSYTALVPRYTDGLGNNLESSMLNFYNKLHSDDNGYDVADTALDNVLQSIIPYDDNLDRAMPGYERYLRYVNKHYLSVPENMRPRLEEFIAGAGLDELKKKSAEESNLYVAASSYLTADGAGEKLTRYLCAKNLSEYFKENYTYSLDARIDDRDPVMSFLTDTKSGHCALYASAMTLILREWGIPARYCTGFAASSDLSVQTLRSKDLHAWCEVFLDELGWVTFDPTASAIFGGQGVGTTSAASSGTGASQSGVSQIQSVQSSEPQSFDVSETDPSVPGTHGSSDAAGGSSLTFAQVLPYILRILGIVAAAAVLALIVLAYNRLKKRANERIRRFRREENSEFVYAKLIAVLRLCKLSVRNGEQPHEFFERAQTALECDICGYYDLFERLAFGSSELDVSERAVLGGAFEKIFRAAERRFIFLGKIRLRLLVLNRKV